MAGTDAPSDSPNGNAPDRILLSVFSHRFMAVAEAMGTVLQKTSISTNIKERLDFSCAIFAPNGDLIANAPHLPVHLGSMSFAVRFQTSYLKGDLKEGDVLLTNHPVAGGSHLPDCTVITPVFQDGEIVFFTASRGHHADVGGILPGSMPPTSKTIFEEGAQIKSFKIVNAGEYDRDGLVKLLCDDPAQYPGCSGTRCLRDVESDLQAQIAANQKGANLIYQMIDEYSLQTVQEYMLHIRDNAEYAVRNLLRDVAKTRGTKLHAKDYLDDGSQIELHVEIDEKEGSAIFDFEGTGLEMIGNLNTPISVTYSAVIYCLRAMVDLDIPLNHGCLIPIDVRIPAGSLLSPSETAAVVGGNVCTSQRITDVVLKAFNAAAASQGDCNNFTFGQGGKDDQGKVTEGWGYYETICGGSGAGPSWAGTSGVHCHMTNTKITDPETLERRYPVILREFSIREGSGGKGYYNGGNGVIRDVEFTEPLQCSILSERRVYRPFGLSGGGDAQCGQNTWMKLPRKEDGDLIEGKDPKAYRSINVSGKQTVKLGKGDRFVIKTPGGGAWGEPDDKENTPVASGTSTPSTWHRGSTRGSVAERKAHAEGV